MFVKDKILFIMQTLSTSFNYLIFKNINEDKLISKFLNDSENVFDIGSNVGSFIFKVSRKNKKKYLKFHSFEPNKEIGVNYKKILRSNNHIIFENNYGIGSHQGKAKFYKNSLSSQSSLKKDKTRLGETVDVHEIEIDTIDNYCKDNSINKIGLLKIDVEGTEIDVLMSARNMLSKGNVNLIKIEIENQNINEVFTILYGYGYELIGITNQTYIKNKLKLADFYFKIKI